MKVQQLAELVHGVEWEIAVELGVEQLRWQVDFLEVWASEGYDIEGVEDENQPHQHHQWGQ